MNKLQFVPGKIYVQKGNFKQQKKIFIFDRIEGDKIYHSGCVYIDAVGNEIFRTNSRGFYYKEEIHIDKYYLASKEQINNFVSFVVKEGYFVEIQSTPENEITYEVIKKPKNASMERMLDMATQQELEQSELINIEEIVTPMDELNIPETIPTEEKVSWWKKIINSFKS